MLYNIKISNGDRADVINYINSCRQINPNYKVVDVGGAHGGWSAPYVDAIVDFNDIPLQSSIKHFKCDITNPNVLIPTSNLTIPNTKIGMSSRFGLQTEPKIIPNKTVRFIEEDFDAYGRNNINPKTGEILAFNENSNYSMF